MSKSVPGPSFIGKHLSPENRLAEVICGLIMVLTFTATTSATFEGTTPHALLIAVLGCNLAWGVVDGMTYILGNILSRGARSRLITKLKQSPNDPVASAEVTLRVDSVLGPLLNQEQRQQVHQWIVERAPEIDPPPTGITKEDLFTALACFVIVIGVAIPILLPFLFIKNEATALRVSNGLMLAMLFSVGWRWAKYASMDRLKTGLALLALGFVLVVITIILGG